MVLTKGGNYATSQYANTSNDQDSDILNSEDMRKLFVTKIPKDTTDDDITSFLEGKAGGTITEKAIVRKETAKHHFGFFTFETSRDVDEVIYKEKDLRFGENNTLVVTRACPKAHYLTGAHHHTTKMFVAGIPKNGVTEEDLKQYFESRHDPKYGTVTEIMFVKKKDENGGKLQENKGFGFVTVSSEHLADTMSIQHSTIKLNGHNLQLKKSDRDGQPGGERGGRGGGRGGYAPRGGTGQRGRGGGGGGRGRGAASQYGNGGGYGDYSGYDYSQYSSGYGSGYDQSWSGYGYGYDSYASAPQQYPQYGVSSAVARGRGSRGKDARGGATRGGAARGKRYTPYAKNT